MELCQVYCRPKTLKRTTAGLIVGEIQYISKRFTHVEARVHCKSSNFNRGPFFTSNWKFEVQLSSWYLWCHFSVVEHSTRSSRAVGSNQGSGTFFPWTRYTWWPCLTRAYKWIPVSGVFEVDAEMLLYSTKSHAQPPYREVSCKVGWVWLAVEALAEFGLP